MCQRKIRTYFLHSDPEVFPGDTTRQTKIDQVQEDVHLNHHRLFLVDAIPHVISPYRCCGLLCLKVAPVNNSKAGGVRFRGILFVQIDNMTKCPLFVPAAISFFVNDLNAWKYQIVPFLILL